MLNAAPPTKKRVLIVDDCPIFLKLLHSLLDDDFIVHLACSGEEAFHLLKSAAGYPISKDIPFDLIITDLEMPGLGGFDIADYVRSKNRENKYTPVIMLTGMDITKEEAREHGCATIIPKSDLNKVRAMSRNILLR